MLKKLVIIISLSIFTLLLSVYGLISMTGIGGGDCDVAGHDCSCFCCHMFGLRGYESCGVFGLLVGAVVSIIISVIVFRKIDKVISLKNTIILFVANLLYLLLSFFFSFIVIEYCLDIATDFSRFKLMHPFSRIMSDSLWLLAWTFFSIFIFRLDKKIISKTR